MDKAEAWLKKNDPLYTKKKEEKWNIPILPKDSYLSGVELKFLLAT